MSGLTVVVVRNPSERVRGFLASVALEISPNVFVACAMNARVRDKVWNVVTDWLSAVPGAPSAVMVWHDPANATQYAVRNFGEPPRLLIEHDGVYLAKVDGA